MDGGKIFDKFILFLILLLFSLGLFFSLVSTSIIASDKLNTNTYYFFIKHLLFIILGVFILITFSAIDKKKLFQVSKYLFLVFLYIFSFSSIYRCRSKRFYEVDKLTSNSKISTY